jgi:glycosyltransferase involved in cell wall biosynthesis
MRVLFVSNLFPPRNVGGAELSAFNTCLGLQERGLDVSALMVNTRLPQHTHAQHNVRGISVCERTFVPVPLGRRYAQVYDPRIDRAVTSEIRRVRPDLVHVHNVSGATLAPFAACRRLGVPVVLTLHDHWLLCPNNMLYQGNGVSCELGSKPRGCGRCFRRYDFWADIPGRRRVFRRFVRDVRLFVSPSQSLIDHHVTAGYDRGRFRVVRNGIHPAAFQPPSDPILGEYVRQSAYTPTILFAGALVESKGVGTLVEAIPLIGEYIKPHVLVAGKGDPSCVAALRRLDPRLVKLLGRVPFEEMRFLYANADLTVVPSVHYDNSPMVIYESLLAGTPVLGAEIGGIPELVREGETGYLFPAGDAGALAAKVVAHFARSALHRRGMRHRCFEYARSHLTMGHHIEDLLAVYHEALGHL